eukprot:Tbor_TRINITY_DN5187_c4_g1::TRINITY_DN5187_c4_g1_i2::g.25590::m.25590
MTHVRGTHRFWPWPSKLPLKKDWFPRLSRNQSIAREVRTVTIVGDIMISSLVVYAAYRVYTQHITGEHQTHLSHLTGHSPAIIAQNFDFTAPPKNNVSRSKLDEYRNDFAKCRTSGAPIESVIFRY